ncbi:MAG TPA: hypothetical protein IAC26_00220 [Candidatus Scatomorpha stercoravium]|nr:hypothetical protein [Candidatus Scatomorpha stercoravium]
MSIAYGELDVLVNRAAFYITALPLRVILSISALKYPDKSLPEPSPSPSASAIAVTGAKLIVSFIANSRAKNFLRSIFISVYSSSVLVLFQPIALGERQQAKRYFFPRALAQLAQAARVAFAGAYLRGAGEALNAFGDRRAVQAAAAAR